jgi:hypothetical protein
MAKVGKLRYKTPVKIIKGIIHNKNAADIASQAVLMRGWIIIR